MENYSYNGIELPRLPWEEPKVKTPYLIIMPDGTVKDANQWLFRSVDSGSSYGTDLASNSGGVALGFHSG